MKQGPPPQRGLNRCSDPCRYFQREMANSGWVEVLLKELVMSILRMSRVSVWKAKRSEGLLD